MKSPEEFRRGARRARMEMKIRGAKSYPSSVRHCWYCKRLTAWKYDPALGHSRCKDCGSGKVGR